MHGAEYIQYVTDCIHKVWDSQKDTLLAVSELIAHTIEKKNNVFVFANREMGLGGMPTGTAGNAIVMLSGGIDSPVATFKMAARGLKIFAIHYHSFPYTSEMAKQKVVDLAKILSKYTGEINLSVVPFTDIQKAIHENCPAEFMITIIK